MQARGAAAQREGSAATGGSLLRLFITIVAPLGFIAFLLAYRIVDRSAYLWIIREDGPFEYLTFLAYLAAAGVALLVSGALARAGERGFAAAFLGVVATCIFIAGEEISWGQRLLKIQTPEFFLERNHQRELNLHNLLGRYALHGAYIALSGAMALSWAVVPRLLRRLPARPRRFLSARQWMFVPDRRLTLYFLPCMLLYLYYDYVNPLQVYLYGPEWHITRGEVERFFIVAKDQEPIELLLGAGILLFLALVLRRALGLRRRG